MLDRFGAAINDHQLFDLRSQVALADTQLSLFLPYLNRLSFEDFAVSWDAFLVALDQKNLAEVNKRKQEIQDFRDGVEREGKALDRIERLSIEKRRAIEGHYRNMAHTAAAMSDAEAASLFAALTAAVRRVVRDPQQLGLIEQNWRKLVAQTGIKEEM